MARPVSQQITGDYFSLKRHVEMLRTIAHEISTEPGIVRMMGPGGHGTDALASYGAQDAVRDLIGSYEMAVSDLNERADRAEIRELAAQVFREHGAERAETRAYLLEKLAERKAA